jgi:bifunctional enzyme CysN/CysC
MSHQSELISQDIDAYLAQHEKKELLRFLTCGSVDDGKSTLIGRLLYDSKMIYEDQLAAIRRDSVVHGTTGGDFDPALLTDGLKAEREQGITIDVAYRYFSTSRRKFIIADTPGHQQYTRNMATGASTCDLAIILIDARNGVVEQTKRHSFIASLLGIKHVLVAVNKMDLVDYRADVFEQIKSDYSDFATRMMSDDLHFIPISALKGDNVVDPSANMPWYDGSTLMHMLENVHIASDRNLIDFRFPVQYVLRPDLNFRGFCGTVSSGIVRVGDEVMVLPSRKTSRIKRIVSMDGDLDEAFAPMSITVTLADEIDVSRGDMIVHPGNVPRVDAKFEAMIVWMAEEPMVPGKQYLLKLSNKLVSGSISTLRYCVDVNTLRRQDAPTLKLNEIGRCSLVSTQPVCFDDYRQNRSTGAFIIIDRLTNNTVGAGMILDRVTSKEHGASWDELPTSEHLRSSAGQVTIQERAARLGQQPATILITGLTGAGKTTVGYALERRLFDEGRVATVVDGQNMRLGLNKDLDFTAEGRSENLRRNVEVARLLNQAGLLCICAFVAPDEDLRQRARDAIGKENFLLVHLDAPLEICRQRDADGMYAKAEAGEIADFPGVSAPYDPPKSADLTLPTHKLSVAECVDRIMKLLLDRHIIH